MFLYNNKKEEETSTISVLTQIQQHLRRRSRISLFVCRCYISCWSIPSIFLFFLFPTFTFCVASQPIPTTTTAAPLLGPIISTTTVILTPPPTQLPLKHNLIILIVVIVISVISCLLFLLFVATTMGCFRFKKLKLRSTTNQICIEANGNSNANTEDQKINTNDDGCCVKRFTWNDLEKFTKRFSRVIGSGGFSNVYLARLPGSVQAAIKIHVGSDRLIQVFKQELDILLRLSHDHIVKLLGFCDDRDEGALVFEYVPNGSLQEKLHGGGRLEKETTVLPWRNRMAIAFQLAQAIEYLHEKCALQIIHGDIKASNILLDEYFNCKLCDFGSAKIGFSSIVAPPSPIRSRTRQLMIGSPGYTDPLYLKTGMASKKNDVYGFGVIILELVTGMEAFCPERGQLLTSIALPILSDVDDIKVAEMVDPRLGGDFDLEEAKVMLSIAALCLNQSPVIRPSATQILNTIEDKICLIFSPKKDLLSSNR